MTVAAEIRAELARQKIPHCSLAVALGITKQSLSRKLMKEESDFSVNQLKSIESYLNIPAWELMRRAEEAEKEKGENR